MLSRAASRVSQPILYSGGWRLANRPQAAPPGGVAPGESDGYKRGAEPGPRARDLLPECVHLLFRGHDFEGGQRLRAAHVEAGVSVSGSGGIFAEVRRQSRTAGDPRSVCIRQERMRRWETRIKWSAHWWLTIRRTSG